MVRRSSYSRLRSRRRKRVLNTRPRCRWCRTRKAWKTTSRFCCAIRGLRRPCANGWRASAPSRRAPFWDAAPLTLPATVRRGRRSITSGSGHAGNCRTTRICIGFCSPSSPTCRCWTRPCCRMARAYSLMCRSRAWITPCGFTGLSAPTTGCSMCRIRPPRRARGGSIAARSIPDEGILVASVTQEGLIRPR